MTEYIYDANNWLRRKFESGQGIRICFAEVRANPGAVVFDGEGGLKRRRDLYPAYKKHRTPPPESIKENMELFRQLLGFLPVPTIRLVGWEADDVIATLVRLSRETVLVRSTDADFLQLPNAIMEERKNPFPAARNRVRLYKATVGDASDNITGIKSFGKKSWELLSEIQRDELEELLAGRSDDVPPGLPNSCHNWLQEAENLALVRTFYQIVDLYDVPMSDIIAGTSFGMNRPDLAEPIFQQFLL